MFDVNIDNRSSKTEKLLYNIWQELKLANTKKEETAIVPTKPIEEKIIEENTNEFNIDSAKRPELNAKAKEYPKGTFGNYSILKTEALREKIRKVM